MRTLTYLGMTGNEPGHIFCIVANGEHFLDAERMVLGIFDENTMMFPHFGTEAKEVFLNGGDVIIESSYYDLSGVLSFLPQVLGTSTNLGRLVIISPHIDVLREFLPSVKFILYRWPDAVGIRDIVSRKFTEASAAVLEGDFLPALWGYGPGDLRDMVSRAKSLSDLLGMAESDIIGVLKLPPMAFAVTQTWVFAPSPKDLTIRQVVEFYLPTTVKRLLDQALDMPVMAIFGEREEVERVVDTVACWFDPVSGAGDLAQIDFAQIPENRRQEFLDSVLVKMKPVTVSIRGLGPKDRDLAFWVINLVRSRLQVQAIVFEFTDGQKTRDFVNWRIPMIQV